MNAKHEKEAFVSWETRIQRIDTARGKRGISVKNNRILTVPGVNVTLPGGKTSSSICSVPI